ncbi:MAG: hypothetical protein GF383_01665 [Candidatus Lokiarchaeota archaeon]|nr:hypothetical protein [Candidatus Lokiarchaeota archaeon]
MTVISKFRALFVAGGILLFLSFFLDWYYFVVIDKSGEILGSWAYSPFGGWTVRADSSSDYAPKDLNLSKFAHVLFIGLICFCVAASILKNFETEENLNSVRTIGYALVFLVVFTGFYLVCFPALYLSEVNLYFPFVNVTEDDTDITYSYAMGPGYFLHALGFAIIFPYSMAYYYAVVKFKTIQDKKKDFLDKLKIATGAEELIDFARMIAEEETLFKLGRVKPDNETPLNAKKRYKGEART